MTTISTSCGQTAGRLVHRPCSGRWSQTMQELSLFSSGMVPAVTADGRNLLCGCLTDVMIGLLGCYSGGAHFGVGQKQFQSSGSNDVPTNSLLQHPELSWCCRHRRSAQHAKSSRSLILQCAWHPFEIFSWQNTADCQCAL